MAARAFLVLLEPRSATSVQRACTNHPLALLNAWTARKTLTVLLPQQPPVNALKTPSRLQYLQAWTPVPASLDTTRKMPPAARHVPQEPTNQTLALTCALNAHKTTFALKLQ
jgi:hypothetical protein